LAACASSCLRFLRIIFMCTSPCRSVRIRFGPHDWTKCLGCHTRI
jgi:hypothetical protein